VSAVGLGELYSALNRLGERDAELNVVSPEDEAWAELTFTQGDEVLHIVTVEGRYWAHRLRCT
jgi:hypothetical protein